MTIDVQHHYFASSLIGEINEMLAEEVGEDATFDHYYNEAKQFDTDEIEDRIERMDEWGLERAVLSFPSPGLKMDVDHLRNPLVYTRLAKIVNNHLGRARKRYPDRFLGFATMPLVDVDAAVDELDRAINDLNLQGILLDSHVLGKHLSDEDFRPFFDHADRMNLPVFIHPTVPAKTARMDRFYFETLLGYPVDTTLTAMDMILTGFLERYENLEIILAHLGGTLPYLAGRLQNAYTPGDPTYEEHLIEPLQKQPREYLDDFWYDTALTYTEAIELVFNTIGNRIVFGSDAPYYDPDKVRPVVEALDVPKREARKIYDENAESILLNI